MSGTEAAALREVADMIEQSSYAHPHTMVIALRACASTIERLQKANANLRIAARVTALIANPGLSHEDIDASLDRAEAGA